MGLWFIIHKARVGPTMLWLSSGSPLRLCWDASAVCAGWWGAMQSCAGAATAFLTTCTVPPHLYPQHVPGQTAPCIWGKRSGHGAAVRLIPKSGQCIKISPSSVSVWHYQCCPEILLKGASLKSSAIKEHLIAVFLSRLSWKDNSPPSNARQYKVKHALCPDLSSKGLSPADCSLSQSSWKSCINRYHLLTPCGNSDNTKVNRNKDMTHVRAGCGYCQEFQ